SPTTRCSFKEAIRKLEVGRTHERQQSEFRLVPSLPNTRHVHFGNCETISYFVVGLSFFHLFRRMSWG
uniref:Uncharacterized protein n=1 Tax=Parascaris univalens TaxID=6257 RepID=A0A914ZEU4_PARUN